ncbi:MAG: hypothetical protein AB1679_12865 [Actinomycetota bacterium]
MDSAGEDAGVNAAGHGGMPGDLGDDRDSEDLGDVGGPQTAGWLVDEEHPVVAARLGGQEAAEGEVAGSPDHDVLLVGVGALRAFQTASCVHHDEARRHFPAPAQLEVRGDRDGRVIGVGRGDPEEGGHVGWVVGDERGGLVPGAEQSDGGGDCAGAMTSSGAADADGSCHVDLLNVGLNGWWILVGELVLWDVEPAARDTDFPDRPERRATQQRAAWATAAMSLVPGGPSVSSRCASTSWGVRHRR